MSLATQSSDTKRVVTQEQKVE